MKNKSILKVFACFLLFSSVCSLSHGGTVTARKSDIAMKTATTGDGGVATSRRTAPQPVYQFFVWMKSGEKTGYLFSDKPEFSVNGDVVSFHTKSVAMDIAITDLDKFTVEQVLPEHPVGISLPEEQTLVLGHSARLAYTLEPADAQTTVTWLNSNPDVVSITPDGMMTALKVGTATLRAQTSNGLRAACEVTVQEPHWRFHVWLRSGEIAGYDLDEHPEVAFGTEVFTLTSSRTTAEYPAADVLRFTLNDIMLDNQATTVNDAHIADAGQHKFEAGRFSLQGAKPCSPVRVFDVSGRTIISGQTDATGSMHLSLGSLPQGIYVIKTESTTYKIYKK